ncbi:hypothetical protein K7X08_031510 [Anisodus acutangulus]|uniref:Dof-type domain-containing protein n=1 Tax=Anisodus acutangulus TaxID=402998 RepID=A0A9Q1RJD6_9SOLA|nr:hypothetical protein K7X08_031510 [Anisodus acutangulus]
MSEVKLFGKTIVLPIDDLLNTTSHDDQITSEGELTQSKNRDVFTNSTADESVEPETSSGISNEPKTQDADRETSSPKSTKEDPSEKVLKKPDKILPCPRCNSMETKFCYYNNYNVNQPRHFCKKCQRYWTAGGTMRNVPVGSGRRKNKSSSTSSYRHIMVSDTLQAARFEGAHGMNLSTFRANGTVLGFGSDKVPLCDSMASILNLAEKSHNSIGNDRSNEACSTTSNSTEKGNNSSTTHDLAWKSIQAFPPQVHHFPGPPWPYSVPPPALSPSGYPVSFYPPPPYWGCTVASPWNVPWVSPPPSYSTSPTSPTLGKHSRDGSMLIPSNSGKEDTLQEKDGERSVVIPKTLRIDDLDEAAKSSMWSTLGIKNEKTDSANGSSRLFKAFNSKVDERNNKYDTDLVLQANPAALSRSRNFQEST